MNKDRHSVIAGSLHNQNMGDHALAKAFVNQQTKNYQNLTILGSTNEDLVSIGETIIPPPPLAIGYRFWSGHKERVETMKKITAQMPEAKRDYIWLGGLLGSNVYHTKTRYQELNWASNFCDKFIYYFGDMHTGFNNSVPAKKLIDKINNSNSWIAVRSNEAANLFVESGLKSKIYVGIDAALYERCKNREIPFTRQQKDVGIVAIIPCTYQHEKYISIWRAAAVSAIKLGMKISWISLCDPEDMTLCEQLFQEFSEKYPHHPMEIISGIDGENKIAESSVCIATRYHGVIFSLAAGVPTIGLPYGDKIKRLLEFLNLGDWIADPNLKPQKELDWNFIVHEIIQAALAGKFQPDYSQLEAAIKVHQEALANLDLFIKN